MTAERKDSSDLVAVAAGDSTANEDARIRVNGKFGQCVENSWPDLRIPQSSRQWTCDANANDENENCENANCEIESEDEVN